MTGYPFPLSAEDHDFFQREMARRCGIQLGRNKAPMMARRLSQRLRALGLASFADYRRELAAAPQSPEWQAVINALTTNKTFFFREIHHFKLLEKLLLDLERRGAKRIRLWSAACSTGEEAFSMALTAHRVLAHRAVDLKILATDIDGSVLDVAREGRFDAEFVGHLPRFARMQLIDSGDGKLTVSDEIRALVSFKQLNLIDASWPMQGPFQAIFCRNVLIYFSPEDQSRVIARMAPLLDEPGILCLGHAESPFGGVPRLMRGPVPTSHCTRGFAAAEGVFA